MPVSIDELSQKHEVMAKTMTDALAIAEKHTAKLANFEGDIESIKNNMNAFDKEEYARVSADATKAVKDLEAATVKLENHTKEIEDLQKIISRPGFQNEQNSNGSEFSRDFTIELDKYLRNDTNFDKEKMQMLSTTEVKNSITDFDHLSYRIRNDIFGGSNPDGGYVLPDAMLNDPITREFLTSPIRSYARVIPMSTRALTVPVRDQIVSNIGVADELDGYSNATTPKYGQKTLTAHGIKTIVRLTPEIIEDAAIDVSAWVMADAREGIMLQENDHFVNGNGIKEPEGFTTLEPWGGAAVEVPNANNYESNKLEYIKTQSATSVTRNGLVRIKSALKGEQYQPNAVWMMNSNTWADIMLLATTDGFPLINPFTSITDDAPARMLGKRVVIAEDLKDLSASSKSIVYGDFSRGYYIGDRVGFWLLVDPFSGSNEGAQGDWVLYKIRKRTGGMVANTQALKIGFTEA